MRTVGLDKETTMAIDPKVTPDPRMAPATRRPHSERAQPGDVIGIESDGETTELGDTAEDEDERRREAEDDARKRD
jgi:peptide subunit release factor RF-3